MLHFKAAGKDMRDWKIPIWGYVFIQQNTKQIFYLPLLCMPFNEGDGV